MADSKEAIDLMLIHEGWYSNHPNDIGGETYRGISRVYFPDWSGWPIVDALKASALALRENEDLRLMVYDFYKQNFWNRFRGDDIKSQLVANELMDIAVNLGVHRACLFLQKALNHLNGFQKRWLDLVEDAIVGPATLSTLDLALSNSQIGERKIALALNNLQGKHYITRVEQDPRQEVFYSGWLERIILKEKI